MHQQRFMNAFFRVQSPRILSYYWLTRDEEFEYQKAALRLYLENVNSYREYFDQMIPSLEEELSVLGEGSKLARGAIQGATASHLELKPIMDPLLQAHIDYGNNLIQILDLLQNNKDNWEHRDGEVFFFSTEVNAKFEELIDSAVRYESLVNTLSEEL